jgi:polysaccharide biosynthesis protein PslF
MDTTLPSRPTIALLGTYPPTQCGLATFSAALSASMQSAYEGCTTSIVEVVDCPRPSHPDVVHQIVQHDPVSIAEGSRWLSKFDAVIVQHEFGIFGGIDGVEILDILDGVEAPIIVVLHTVLTDATEHRRYVIETLCDRAAAVVVMTEAARMRLVHKFDVDQSKLHVIFHGAHENRALAVDRKPGAQPTILTWGLLGPGKGIEAGIDALVELQDLIPSPRYVVAGETHPKVKAATGETYRESLKARARQAGVEHLVEFDDRYRDVDSLNQLIRSADVVLVPYESRDQVTSGVLIEAVASRRPVVATDFPHARELLSSGAGIVVHHGDPTAIASALSRILTDRRFARSMAAEAATISDSMMWSTVGGQYLQLVERLIAAAESPVAETVAA